ncbi:MAG: hypothetical protein ACRELB_06400, partial [Polyangiaceae bacterium]
LGANGTYTIDQYAAQIPLDITAPAITGSAGASGSGPTMATGTFGAGGTPGVAFTWNGELVLVTRQPDGKFKLALADGYAASPIAAINFGGGAQVGLAAMGTGASSTILSLLQASVYGPVGAVSTTDVTSAAAGATGAVAGDFDGDGKVDLALTSPSAVTVLLEASGS